MATAAPTVSLTFTQDDIAQLERLQARFLETTKVNARTRRERLAIIIEGFQLFQSYGGYSSEAAHAVYESLQIGGRVSDAKKAAMAITGENPSVEADSTEKNRIHGRVRTAAGILVELESDYDAGIFGEEVEVEDAVKWIEDCGGWRAYGERGNHEVERSDEHSATGVTDSQGTHAERSSGAAQLPTGDLDNVVGGAGVHGQEQSDDGGASGEAPTPVKGSAASDPVAFDLAECRRLIEQAGITATPTATIVAPTPRVAFICGSEGTDVALMTLTDVPIGLLQQLLAYRPHPDEHVSNKIKAWAHVTSGLQLFDRIDSSAPVDPDVDPYVGQDMKPSLPGIVFDDPEHLSISASRSDAGMVISIALQFPLITGKGNVTPPRCWVHGRGTNSLTRNLSSAEHRAAYLDPELLTGSEGSLKVKFRVRGTAETDRKDFTVALNPIEDIPADYWLLRVKKDLRVSSLATFTEPLAAEADMLKFVAGAGAARSLKKTVKLAVTRTKELALTLGTSKRNVISGCSVDGEPATCEVRATDFARAFAFGQAIGAQHCHLAMEPNGLLLIAFVVDDIGQFSVAIPTLREGIRERVLLERVPG